MHSIFKKIVFLWTLFFTTCLFSDSVSIGIHITDATINESAGTMTFTITLDNAPIFPISIDYNTIDGSAIAGEDYVATTDYLLFGLGISSRTFTINILNDNIYEVTQSFYINLSTTASGYISTYDGTGTILDDDPQPLSVSVYGQAVNEIDDNSQLLTFTFRLNQTAPTGGVTVNYRTVDGTAYAGSDYVSKSSSVFIASGTQETTIQVSIIGDLIPESPISEYFKIEITSVSAGAINQGIASGTIYDNDTISIHTLCTNTLEGNIGDSNKIPCRIYLDKTLPIGQPDITINYQTADGSTPSAIAATDYNASSGSVTFTVGDLEKIVYIPIIGDNDIEKNEQLLMLISGSSYISNSSTTAYILNDDGAYPVLSCSSTNVSILEGDSGQTVLTYNFTLDAPALANTSFEYETKDDDEDDKDDDDGDGDSHDDDEDDDKDGDGDDDDDNDDDDDDNDYIPLSKTTYTINTGDSNISLSVTINSDTKIENDEQFQLQLSNANNLNLGSCATIDSIIVNDDGTYPSLSFVLNNYEVVEGNNSTTTINFQLQLDQPALTTSSFDYYTNDGSATTSNNDYADINRSTYTFSGGEQNITIPITVNGDIEIEGDELFYLKIDNEKNLTISGIQSISAKIINDDIPEFPFSCNEDSFISFNRDSSATAGDSLFNTISLANGTLLSSDILGNVNGVNSIGYNTIDNFIWGYNLDLNKIVRIDSQKQVKIYDIPGLISRFYVAADVDKNGILYLFSRGSLNEQKMLIPIDLNTLTTLPSVILDHEIDTADMAFNPVDGNLYFIENYTSNLYKIIFSSDKRSGTVQLVGDTNIGLINPIINFFDRDGNFYFNKDITSMYKIDTNVSASATLFSTLDNQLRNGDGARCANAPVTPPVPIDTPLICDSSMYLSSSIKRGTGETGKMWLHKINTQTNPFTFDVVDDIGEVKTYNALAYSDAGDSNSTNFIFGLYNDELIKIGASGKVINLGVIPALSPLLNNRQFFAGTAYNGYYYISGPGVDYNKMFKINLSDKNVTEIILDTAISLLDFSFTVDGQFLHGIVDGGKLVKIDINSGAVTFIGSAHTGYQFDSTFSDKNGRFFANDSFGNGFFEFDLNTGNKLFLSNSQPATFNDGANCLKEGLLFTDYGDAPDTYKSPRHTIANGIFMGTKVDHDIAPYHNSDASGDDINGTDDEDGVTLIDGSDLNGSYFPKDAIQELNITVSKAGYLNAWLDFNINGLFDSGEQIFTGKALSSGVHTLNFTVPNTVLENQITYIRFRFSSTVTLDFEESATDGEVEDYAVYFGSATQPLKGTFNIERINSGTEAINTTERNAWYTQIVGRDFHYSVVFYDENITATQDTQDITFKVTLYNNETNSTITEMNPFYGHFSSLNPSHRISIMDSSDLNQLSAYRNVVFQISYAINADQSLVQSPCPLGNYEMCFNTLASNNTIQTISAQDNFSIRPKEFLMSIEDKGRELVNNDIPHSERLASGYLYNLNLLAMDNNLNVTQQYNSDSVNQALIFMGNKVQCSKPLDNNKSISFHNGINLDNNFTHEEAGIYILTLADKMWTYEDWKNNKNDCIENNSSISDYGYTPSGCTLSTKNDLTLNYYPHHFQVNMAMNALPNSGHDEFIYMSEINSTSNDFALQFVGTITAQSKSNVTTENFTEGCSSENIHLTLNANIESDTGVNQALLTTTSNQGLRGNVLFNRVINYNNSTFTNDGSIANIQTAFEVSRNRFLNTQKGRVDMDIRYNIDKNITQPINPISINCDSILVTAQDAHSKAEELDNYVPEGNVTINGKKFFYYAQVAPDAKNYSRVNYTGSPVIVSTPISVDIFCKNSNMTFCSNMNIFNHTNIYSSPRQQQGWYLSTEHNALLDGQVSQLLPQTASLTVTPNSNISFTNGSNNSIKTQVNDGANPMNPVIVVVPKQLKYNSNPLLHGNPQYNIPTIPQTSSEWTGVGQTGHIIDGTIQTKHSGKSEW